MTLMSKALGDGFSPRGIFMRRGNSISITMWDRVPKPNSVCECLVSLQCTKNKSSCPCYQSRLWLPYQGLGGEGFLSRLDMALN